MGVSDRQAIVIGDAPPECGEPDSDGNGKVDPEDNCLDVVNPDQRDSDQDGFANACAADYNGDGS